jgi:UPF0271 protein
MIDINSDVGEFPHLLEDGTYYQLMDYITSINIACGGHAGDYNLMKAMIRMGIEKNVNIGAHPGYPDKENFGRKIMVMNPSDIMDTIIKQIENLFEIAAAEKTELQHVKPHGALYNQAAKSSTIAHAIGLAVKKIDPQLTIVGLSDSLMIDTWKEMGLNVAREAFADRSYEADGSLRNRELENALITNPSQAAKQAMMIIKSGEIISVDGNTISINAQTICIHSDTPNALAIAKAVKNRED